MKILLVTGEALPYCKSGGLADFIWSFSKALVKENEDVSVILPYYRSIRERFPEVQKGHYDTFDFNMNWRNQGCGVFKTTLSGVDFYFLAMDEWFDRDGLYGYGDDIARFSAFMMAVNTFITRHNEFDVVHCNDWQTAVLPLLLRYNPRNIKTVLTIHNPAYQGFAKREDLSTYFNLHTDFYDHGLVRLGDSFNFLKTGVMTADKITTVSRTHAQELLNDHEGFNKIGAIIDWFRHYDFVGIVNGLDTEVWNPKTDKNLVFNYDVTNHTEGKKINKMQLLNLLGMSSDFRGPLYASVTRLSAQKGVERLIQCMPHLKDADARLIVIGTGEKEDEFLYEALKYPEVYFIKRYDESLAHLLYAAADYFLMPSYFEPCGTSQLISMRYGTVPIVSNVGGLNDTVKDLSTGDEATGFVFNNSDYYGFINCFYASSSYFYNQGLEKEINNGMRGEYGWERSAREYIALYDSINWK